VILEKLKEYADTRMDLPPPMYRSQPVRWFINLNIDGELEGFTPLGGTNKSDKRGMNFVVPDFVRASGIKAKVLVDNGEYVLGIGKEGAINTKVLQRFENFKDVIRTCLTESAEPTVQAVLNFLEEWQPNLERVKKLAPGFDSGDTIAFRVEGINPANLPSVQRFWAAHTSNSSNDASATSTAQCLVTGEITSVEARMPGKVKGIPGGQTAGTSLVSANAKAFEHYGLENSLTSPISRDAAERFTKALNELIANENSRLYVGALIYTFWTRKETEFNAWKLLSDPKPDDVKLLFKSAFTGNKVYAINDNEFYALALSASGGRAVIRDWLETTIPDAQTNLARYFKAQEICTQDGMTTDHHAIFPLTSSLYRDFNKEVTANIPAHFIRVAIKGGILPLEILEKAVRRTRAESNITHPRIAVIKLALCMQPKGEVFMEMTKLDPDPPLEPRDALAYQCGRLLAELEAIQRAALGKINATIVDRYYGSASSTPQNGFAPLLSGVQAHLSKLRKNRVGTYLAKQQALEDILKKFPVKDSVPQFPTSLTMREQGIFAIGYYHQRADNRAAAELAKQAQNPAKTISNAVPNITSTTSAQGATK
jgi:CRISPR-associated protein Csd1